jgi:multidrug efflux pump subunit AcrA (membrane-fusion protein)
VDLDEAPRRRRPWVLATAAVLGITAVVAAGVWFAPSLFTTSVRPDLLTHKVEPVFLPITVVERGTLESATNVEVMCKVKAGSRGTFASTIKRVIEDGTEVRKGQWLMDLDDSSLKEQDQSQKIAVSKATAAFITATENLNIQLKTNDSDKAAKWAALQVAELDLEKFLGIRREPALDKFGAAVGAAFTTIERGEYRMQLDDVSGRLKLSESDLQAYADRSAWAERSVRLKYMTPSQAQVERAKYESQKDAVAKLQAEKFALENFTRARELTDLSSKVEVAKAAYEQAFLQAYAKVVTMEAEVTTAESVLNQEREKMSEITVQLIDCKIFAPQDGMVVYYKETSRWGSSSQGLIATGEQVKEGQKMLRLPDLRSMQVSVRIHEALIDRIRGDDRRPTGVVEGARAALLANPHAFSRLLSQSDYLLGGVRESLEDQEFVLASRGQPAVIRVDAKPGRTYTGRVRSVAAVASQTDWMSSEVKLYQTIVSIDDSDVSGLKPDMSAEVSIQVDPATDKVLAVPIQAVLGGAESGGTRELYVLDAGGQPQLREVTLGVYNDLMVEVKKGLAVGDLVVLNPKVIVSDQTRVREPGDPTGRGSTKTGRPGGEKSKSKGGDTGKAGTKEATPKKKE